VTIEKCRNKSVSLYKLLNYTSNWHTPKLQRH